MGLFSKKGSTNPKRSGGFTVTGISAGKGKANAARKEWKAPRKGDLAHRASKRP